MRIHCPSCGNPSGFLVPLWVKVTFKFEDSGAISILHVRQLESLEEKIVDQGQAAPAITCKACGGAAEVELNEYENLAEQNRQRQALEAL